eukprot:817333-Prymnesium_polylepis.2
MAPNRRSCQEAHPDAQLRGRVGCDWYWAAGSPRHTPACNAEEADIAATHLLEDENGLREVWKLLRVPAPAVCVWCARAEQSALGKRERRLGRGGGAARGCLAPEALLCAHSAA